VGFWGVRYQVKDVQRSVAFYTQTLGFKLDMQNLPAFGQVSIGRLKLILIKVILEADPGIVEEWKWMGSPAWFRDGLIAVGNAHKDKVKLTFSHGASLPDPDQLFNAGFEGTCGEPSTCERPTPVVAKSKIDISPREFPQDF